MRAEGPAGGAVSGSVRLVNSAADIYASPGVRKFARELGVDLMRVKGGGHNNRITIADVQSHVKNVLGALQLGLHVNGGSLLQQPDIDFSQFGEVEIVELERIRKISARAVHRNWLLIPHVTQFDHVDITDLETFRKANNASAVAEDVRLTSLAFLLKVAASALQAFPDLNSSLYCRRRAFGTKEILPHSRSSRHA